MQTTEIVVEILVIGGGISLCAAPLAAGLIGESTSQLLSTLDLKELVVVAITVVYPIGLCWSRLADALFKGFDAKLLEKAGLTSQQYHDTLVRISANSSNLASDLARVRSVYRVARASCITFLVATISGPIALTDSTPATLFSPNAIIVSVAFLLCSIASYLTWKHLRESYLAWLAVARSIPAF